MPNASILFNGVSWDQNPVRPNPRIMDYAKAWIPMRTTGGKWIWNKKVYIEQAMNSKYHYYDEEEFFLETLVSEKPVEVGNRVSLIFNNRYIAIAFLPISIPMFFLFVVLIAVFFGWKDYYN